MSTEAITCIVLKMAYILSQPQCLIWTMTLFQDASLWRHTLPQISLATIQPVEQRRASIIWNGHTIVNIACIHFTEHSIYAKFATNESVKYIGFQFVILPLIQCHNFCKILLMIFKFCTRISLKCTCDSKTRIIGSIHTYMYIYTVYTQIYLYKVLKFYLFRRSRPPSLLAVLLITFYGNRSSILC